MLKATTPHCELAIIGAGMAGMAATLFAANRGISCIQIGQTGGIAFSSGLLDLMGVHPIQKGHRWLDPWAAIAALKADLPEHPYSRLSRDKIQSAFNEFMAFLEEGGLSYFCDGGQNVEMITSLGTVKLSYAVPASMKNGVQAWQEKASCLIIDFEGMKGFSAGQITATLNEKWPNIRSSRLTFPGMEAMVNLQPEYMARQLDQSEVRSEIAGLIKPLIKSSKFIGFPAILGMNDTTEAISDLENRLGTHIFEIPTMPVSIPGYRLLTMFEKQLRQRGIRQLLQKKVLAVSGGNGDFFTLTIGNRFPEISFESKAVLLASGRFLGKGLEADRKEIRETIFNLPVSQPETRNDWYEKEFFNPRGHDACRSGLEVDDQFRPLNHTGQPAFESLYAAGSILAHQDWTRMKCGAGLAIASAYGAVTAFHKSY